MLASSTTTVVLLRHKPDCTETTPAYFVWPLFNRHNQGYTNTFQEKQIRPFSCCFYANVKKKPFTTILSKDYGWQCWKVLHQMSHGFLKHSCFVLMQIETIWVNFQNTVMLFRPPDMVVDDTTMARKCHPAELGRVQIKYKRQSKEWG